MATESIIASAYVTYGKPSMPFPKKIALVIHSLDGDDTVNGGSGRDTLYTGAGADDVAGGIHEEEVGLDGDAVVARSLYRLQVALLVKERLQPVLGHL